MFLFYFKLHLMVWKAATAATYTLIVYGIRPAEKPLWRNSSTGSKPCSRHQTVKTCPFRPYSLLVDGALELSMILITHSFHSSGKAGPSWGESPQRTCHELYDVQEPYLDRPEWG